MNPYELPMLNTVLLLSSGSTITYSHHTHIQGKREDMLLGLIVTVLLALIFTGLETSMLIFFVLPPAYGFIYNYYSSTEFSPSSASGTRNFKKLRSHTSSITPALNRCLGELAPRNGIKFYSTTTREDGRVLALSPY